MKQTESSAVAPDEDQSSMDDGSWVHTYSLPPEEDPSFPPSSVNNVTLEEENSPSRTQSENSLSSNSNQENLLRSKVKITPTLRKRRNSKKLLPSKKNLRNVLPSTDRIIYVTQDFREIDSTASLSSNNNNRYAILTTDGITAIDNDASNMLHVNDRRNVFQFAQSDNDNPKRRLSGKSSSSSNNPGNVSSRIKSKSSLKNKSHPIGPSDNCSGRIVPDKLLTLEPTNRLLLPQGNCAMPSTSSVLIITPKSYVNSAQPTNFFLGTGGPGIQPNNVTGPMNPIFITADVEAVPTESFRGNVLSSANNITIPTNNLNSMNIINSVSLNNGVAGLQTSNIAYPANFGIANVQTTDTGKRRRHVPVYVGDITAEDLEDKTRFKAFWKIATATISRQRKKIKNMTTKLARSEKKVQVLTDRLKQLEDTNSVEDIILEIYSGDES